MNLSDMIASFNPLDRLEGLLRSVRVSRGLRRKRFRLVGVKPVYWPRTGPDGPTIERHMQKYGIQLSNRRFAGDARTGMLGADVPATQAKWAQYLIDQYCAGRTVPAWKERK